MNITDIFFIIGEWNWDAISVIALVVITAWYAYQVKKQTELLEADRKRKIILERIQAVINPFIRKIDSELDSIKRAKISISALN